MIEKYSTLLVYRLTPIAIGWKAAQGTLTVNSFLFFLGAYLFAAYYYQTFYKIQQK